MKWAGRLMASVASVLITAGAGLSASTAVASPSADAAWSDATKSNTLEAYAAFAMMYPDSKHAQSAHIKLFAGETVSANAASMDAPVFGDDELPLSRPGFAQPTLMII